MSESLQKMLGVGITIIVIVVVLFSVGSKMIRDNSASTSSKAATNVGVLNGTTVPSVTP